MTCITREIIIEKVINLKCDLCGSLSENDKVWGKIGNFHKTTITHTEQVSNTCDMKETCHLCPKCWNDKLVPFLNQNGVSLTTEELNHAI